MVSLQCDVCMPSIENFYDMTFDMVESNRVLHAMAVKNSGRFLEPARVVIVKDEAGYHFVIDGGYPGLQVHSNSLEMLPSFFGMPPIRPTTIVGTARRLSTTRYWC